MAFEDLLLPNAYIEKGEFYEYVVGESLYIPGVAEDNDDARTMFDFSTGYTAAMTLNLPDGTDVLDFTQTLTSGRQIDLTKTTSRNYAIRSTPAGVAALSAYVGRALVFNLIVTHTASGIAVALIRECFIVPKNQND